MLHKKDNPEKKEEKYGSLTLLGSEDDYGDEENLSYYSDTGGNFDSEFQNDTMNTVLTANEHVLFEKGMDDYGINSLDDYLLRYLNYYIGENIYYATIMEEDYVADVNFPVFYVQITIDDDAESIYRVKCIYKKPYKRYLFYCNEIEYWKEKQEKPPV